MGLLDVLKGLVVQPTQNVEEVRKQKFPDVKHVGPVPVKTVEVGSTGTEIYSGYISEEYLSELRGEEWADKVDMMRRSDPNVKMILGALKSPIKSSNWYFKKLEDTPMAEMQKKLLEKALFEDINKSFTKFIGEALSCLDFGYSLFEITYQPKMDDKEIGSYNTLKSLAWRSQRTIQTWNILNDGTLISVSQWSFGDVGRTVDLDSRFLLHFAPEQEGDNFEGVSVLRACYGNWLRKNMYLKLLAAGMEKYAIPTPVMKIPEGKDGSPEFRNALNALKCYVSNQSNYMTIPAGWELEFNNVNFDAETIVTAIDFENKEMVKSILASFLLLGQNGTGSHALSSTLSDFFGQSVTYIADHLIEQITRKVIQPLVAMNFGEEKLQVELVCDGLEDKATNEWANMIKALSDGGLIKVDTSLEEFIREKYKLPEKDIVQPVAEPSVTPEQTPPPIAPKLAEKKKPKGSKNDKEAALIKKTSDLLKQAGSGFLHDFKQKYIKSVLSAKSKANSVNEVKAPINANVPSISAYINTLKAISSYTAIEANDIQEKNFNKKTKKLAEFNLANTKLKRVEDAVDELTVALKQLSEAVTKEEIAQATYNLGRISDKVNLIFGDYLTFEQKQKIAAKSEVFAETQKNDVIKAIDLQYQSSLNYADDDQLEQDMDDAASKKIDDQLVNAGADVQASTTVNDSLQDAAQQWSEETGDQIVSWTFIAVDDDVTTDICRELNGMTLAEGDPNVDKYSPPLHFNCRSYLRVNTSSMKDNPEITGIPKLSKSAQSQIQFGEMSTNKKRKVSKTE